jgi:anaerobic sulfite reductase subunit A
MYEEEISVELLEELSKQDSPILKLGTSRDLNDDLKKGFDILGRYLEDVKKRDLIQVKLELAVEYANLFLGVERKPAHPSESAYRSIDHSIYQEQRDQVMRMYWKAGVDKEKQFTEPEDHIAVELRFMEYLCQKSVESLEKSDYEREKTFHEFQNEFVIDHLGKWIPSFADEVLEQADTDFYKGVAIITKSFINLERESADLPPAAG